MCDWWRGSKFHSVYWKWSKVRWRQGKKTCTRAKFGFQIQCMTVFRWRQGDFNGRHSVPENCSIPYSFPLTTGSGRGRLYCNCYRSPQTLSWLQGLWKMVSECYPLRLCTTSLDQISKFHFCKWNIPLKKTFKMAADLRATLRMKCLPSRSSFCKLDKCSQQHTTDYLCHLLRKHTRDWYQKVYCLTKLAE